MDSTQQFHWKRQPTAENLLKDILNHLRSKNAEIADLEEELRKHTSTNMFDWVDYFAVIENQELVKRLKDAGFVAQVDGIWHHPGAQLPRIVFQKIEGIAIKVEWCSDFLMMHGKTEPIEGAPYSRFRRALVSQNHGAALWVVERRCFPEVDPAGSAQDIENYLFAREMWQTRKRTCEDEEKAMQNAINVAKEMIFILGRDLAAWIVLEVERHYWQGRNLAGQVQKNRQDRLGMGWANHDHHTFRSSRRFFPLLVELFELLGFHCRERFYAGEEAGWGAQVMENPHAGLVLFLDLDLSPDELQIDFAHQSLPELPTLGTVGLWCALHGDSILKAGMHHLEAQFAFEGLTEDLHHHGIGMMEPFSNFSYLKQAFTHGEQWVVDPKRLDVLFAQGKISAEEMEHFISCGAVGSHLENLQRKEGYKGFNQKNVSYIIKQTDPRIR